MRKRACVTELRGLQYFHRCPLIGSLGPYAYFSPEAGLPEADGAVLTSNQLSRVLITNTRWPSRF